MIGPAQYRKALVGSLVAALSALSAGLADGALTVLEGVTVASAALMAFETVYWTRNAKARSASGREIVEALKRYKRETGEPTN